MTAVDNLEPPAGWTVTHEQRPPSQFDADPDSAFGDGMNWVVRDPAGQRPAQAEWPTAWRRQAVAYAHSVAARRAAVDEPSPPYAASPANPSLLVAVPRPDPVRPGDWTGLPHQRPGVYRRWSS
jgi:hypothetical protein